MEVLGYFPISHTEIIIIIQRTTCRTFPSFATEVEQRERGKKRRINRSWHDTGITMGVDGWRMNVPFESNTVQQQQQDKGE